MEYARLGDSDLKVSKVILGTMGYGAPEWQGWVLNEEESLPLIEHAYKKGIRTLDTSVQLGEGESGARESRLQARMEVFDLAGLGGNVDDAAALAHDW
ncbi:hypothetical protein N7486_011012 [Penicillium sp. IBT 16267x]|nr:hypothetical protein N7486_011012 [Penicillium sp. IBT 16267x]